MDPTTRSSPPEASAEAHPALLTTEEAARFLSVRPRWLELRRHQGGDGPPFVRVSSRQIRYDADALRRWIEDRTHRHTGQYAVNAEVLRGEGGKE